jgi:hypothetical protein
MVMNTGQESQDKRHELTGRKGHLGLPGTTVTDAMAAGPDHVSEELKQVFSDMGECKMMMMMIVMMVMMMVVMMMVMIFSEDQPHPHLHRKNKISYWPGGQCYRQEEEESKRVHSSRQGEGRFDIRLVVDEVVQSFQVC